MSEEIKLVEAKSYRMVVLEASLYFFISALTPVIAILESTKELTARTISCTILSGLLAGAISLKAFLSQSRSPKEKS